MTTEAHSGDLRNSQLFLDDRLIDDHVRVQRVWHQPQKYPKPVMEGKYPWEGDCPCLYGTVLRVDGKFRMWYVGTRNSSKPRVCYAESDDGIHWERPFLGICEFGGNRNNNIVIQPKYPDGFIDDCAMIYEPDDEWPYKLLYWDSLDVNPDHWGIFATRSKDGIHFESLGNVLHKWDDRFAAVTDKVDGKYRVYGRGTFETGVERAGLWQGRRTDFVTEYGLDPFPRKRPVSYTESEDLIHWTPGEQVMKPDTDDPWQMQFYSLTPFYYEGIWLAGALRMHTIPDLLDEELVWSYDGKDWRRSIPRQPFIPLGPKGNFDSVWLNLPTNPPIVNYNQLWFYYSGRAGGHGAQVPEAYGAIGLATLRIDGFCSLYGGEQPGALLTKPVTWPGGELLVNADPRRDITRPPQRRRRHLRQHPGGGARRGEQAARRLRLRRLQPDHPQHPQLRRGAGVDHAGARQTGREADHLEGWPLRPRLGRPPRPPLLRGPRRPPVLLPRQQLHVSRQQFLTAGPDRVEPFRLPRRAGAWEPRARGRLRLSAFDGPVAAPAAPIRHATAVTSRALRADRPARRTCCARCAAGRTSSGTRWPAAWGRSTRA